MKQAIEMSGRCLCGKVTVSANILPSIGACHCGMCRKWSGGPSLAVHVAGKVHFDGEQFIQTYSSSAWAERGFCSNCGTNLFYRLLPREGLPDGEHILFSGLLDKPDLLSFDSEIFIDQAPEWLKFADSDKRHCMTEAEVFAKYNG